MEAGLSRPAALAVSLGVLSADSGARGPFFAAPAPAPLAIDSSEKPGHWLERPTFGLAFSACPLAPPESCALGARLQSLNDSGKQFPAVPLCALTLLGIGFLLWVPETERWL